MSGRNAFVSCVVNFLQTDQAASCAALRRRRAMLPRQQPHDGGLERGCRTACRCRRQYATLPPRNAKCATRVPGYVVV